jgi:hypothetical protein
MVPGRDGVEPRVDGICECEALASILTTAQKKIK